MKVLETSEGQADNKTEAAEPTLKEQKEKVFEEVEEALESAAASIESKKPKDPSEGTPGKPLSVDIKADPDEYVKENPSLASAKAVSSDRFSAIADDGNKTRLVEVTEDEKNAFIESVVSGNRYSGKASLFGGRINVVFRSRAAVESEAIDSFLRYRGMNGVIKSSVSYVDALRFCILAAGVESINDEHYPTLISTSDGNNENMFYRDSPDGTKEPCWVWMFDKWRDRSEYLVAAILNEYFAFEAKYWKLIERAADENFWNPGGSTGK